jgi:hypothetical protein
MGIVWQVGCYMIELAKKHGFNYKDATDYLD